MLRENHLFTRMTMAEGRIPGTAALDYWKRRLEQYLSEGGGIPMEAIDEIWAVGGDEEVERWLANYGQQPA
jgi:hypothetical protein